MIDENELTRLRMTEPNPIRPIEEITRRARQIRKRRTGLRLGAGGAAFALVAVAVGPTLHVPGSKMIRALTGGRHPAAGQNTSDPRCNAFARPAEPHAADAVRYLATEIPAGLELTRAFANEELLCGPQQVALVLAQQRPDGTGPLRALAVWPEVVRVEGSVATPTAAPSAEPGYIAPASSGVDVRGTHGSLVATGSSTELTWTELGGANWRVTSSATSTSDLLRVVDALRIDATTGVVSLPAPASYGFEAVPLGPTTFAVPTWSPVWYADYLPPGCPDAAQGANCAGFSVLVNTRGLVPPEAVASQVSGSLVTYAHVHGHLAVQQDWGSITALTWQERPGIVVQVRGPASGVRDFAERLALAPAS